MKKERIYHEAELAPLIQEIPVDIDTVRLAKIFRDESTDAGEVFLFERVRILDISQLCRQCCSHFVCHDDRFSAL
jgi:hypothetical protein